ncbi:hypothetical protein FE257_006718 [Aspergillus nanangensis]|uniref:Alcohol dehydrogenase iron-type/glycerol dehydrogenase GldA domain-containing protein n=1 Tax=Aspergillus nanangensis TaxID=2582783 RepID=A0AAD4GW08_ASPNN|nr:hypothetical protein FE257_006718 [Aspergillus nanangensis]
MTFTFGTEVCRAAFDGGSTPWISFGLRYFEATRQHCQDAFCCLKVYIICSRSIAQNTDALDRLRSALGDRVAGVRIGINPHTPLSQVLEVVHDAEKREADCLVTLGAGSLTDTAKIVRLALANSARSMEDLDTLWGTAESNPRFRNKVHRPTIPLIHIPTSLSGGEYQAIAGATEPQSQAKRTFHCEGVNPELVIQDPELCLTTPQWVWLSTGIRAVDHCVETLCSLRSNEKGDACSRRALPKLISGLLQSMADPSSLDARHLCQQGVVDAMAAVSSGVPLGASHAIGHQLGPLGVGHGETSCILLPSVCNFNLKMKANIDRQAAVRDLLLEQSEVWVILNARNDLSPTTSSLGDVLDAIISALRMPRSLEDVGVGIDKIPTLAKNSLDDIWIRTNAFPITREEHVRDILATCLRR